MKVEKTTVSTTELDITGATLLTAEEVEQLPERLRKYKAWWWLESPGYSSQKSMYVRCYGTIDYRGDSVYLSSLRVRPVLIISNLKSTNFQIGDKFKIGDRKFEIISNDKAFCLTDIGECAFRNDWEAPDANDYEKSDIKKYVDEWFEKSIKESNNEDKETEEIKEIKEELDKLSKEIEKIHQIISSQNRSYAIAYTEVPSYCRNCKNHPINGGSGICKCIFGEHNYSPSFSTDQY